MDCFICWKNHYYCSICGIGWEDIHSDNSYKYKCPSCQSELIPYFSEDIDQIDEIDEYKLIV